MSYEVFEKLCKTRDVSPADVSRGTGVATSTLSNWKKGNYTPKREKMQKIADYLGGSLQFLETGKEADKEGGYYLDDEARDLAQFLFENPEYRVLFDASRKVKKADIEFVREMIDRASRCDVVIFRHLILYAHRTRRGAQ